MADVKIIDKSVYESLNDKRLIRKGDFKELAELTGKSRQHIKIAICNEGSTTEDVVSIIMDFYTKRINEKKETADTINDLI